MFDDSKLYILHFPEKWRNGEIAKRGKEVMKHIQKFSLTAVLVFLLNITIVHAALMDPVTSKLRYIFFNLGTTAAFSVWLKFAFFVIIFAVLHGAGMRIPALAEGPMKRAVAVIAFVIALTTAILVPYKLMLYIFRMYHAILVILFAMLPAAIGFVINQKLLAGDDRLHRILRGIIYILITIFIFGLIGNIQKNSSPETQLYSDLTEPLMWGGILALAAGLGNLLMALGGDKVVNAIGERLGRTTPAAADATHPADAAHPPGAEHPPEGAHPPAGDGTTTPHATPAERIDAIRAFGTNAQTLQGHVNQAEQAINTTLMPIIQQIHAVEQQIQAAGGTPGGIPPNLIQQRDQLVQQARPIAQQIMAIIQQAQQNIATGQNLLNIILRDHAAYQAIPQQVRDMFENNLTAFINLQNRTCGAYAMAHQLI